MKALILAAGFGTRLLPHTEHTPKALFPIAGRPVLDHMIRHLVRCGCRAAIVNTHHLHRRVENYIAGRTYEIPVTTRYEPEILGTGGAIKNVADFIDGQPFLVVNADIVTDIDLKAVFDTTTQPAIPPHWCSTTMQPTTRWPWTGITSLSVSAINQSPD